jgi:hypothetical protein
MAPPIAARKAKAGVNTGVNSGVNDRFRDAVSDKVCSSFDPASGRDNMVFLEEFSGEITQERALGRRQRPDRSTRSSWRAPIQGGAA